MNLVYDDELRATIEGVLESVDGVLGTRVSFVSIIEGDRWRVIDSIDHEGMGFSPGLDVDLSDTF